MKLKNILFLSVVVTALTACEDMFDPAIENNHDITQMYTDPQFARGIMDNANLVLPYDEYPTTEMATDNAVSNELSNRYSTMAKGAWSPSNNPVNEWDTRYHAIQYLNLFLENADQVVWDPSSESLSAMHGDNYKGNAYALRGLHFFYLLRAHAGKVDGVLMGVPIHLSSEDGSSDFNQPRASFKDCIDQIMSDFDEASKLLPREYGDVEEDDVPAKYKQMGGNNSEYNRAFGNLQRGKIDGRMIDAFRAQVALFAASPAYASGGAMTYEQAAQYAATSLANAGGLDGMDPEGWRWYCDTKMIQKFKFDGPDPAEICWRGVVQNTTTPEDDNYPPSLYGKGRVNPTQNLVDAFPMANGYPISDPKSGYDANNPYENRDPRLKEYILVNGGEQGPKKAKINTQADNESVDGLNYEDGLSTRTGFYLKKLLRPDVNLKPKTEKRHFGARIRYTEIFLAYAEAANEAGGPQAKFGGASYSAYDVIKALHNRAGVGNEYLESIKNDKDKMRELIRNERRLELCFENHRFWDLRRWNLKIDEAAKGVSITTDAETGNAKYQFITVEPRDFKDYMIYGPLPYSEILKYDALRQNDGWPTVVHEDATENVGEE
ncbi:MAG: RagB/SusD family nutrient uptake outer membrane protein [Prevotella sp.]|nr:RagB/SusD family nutrient uptake outer membrane protein [Prevotella sp.]